MYSTTPLVSSCPSHHDHGREKPFFTWNCLHTPEESIGHHLYDTAYHSLNHLHWPIYSLRRKGHYWNGKLYFIIAPACLYPLQWNWLSRIYSPQLFFISLYLPLLSVREGRFWQADCLSWCNNHPPFVSEEGALTRQRNQATQAASHASKPLFTTPC